MADEPTPQEEPEGDGKEQAAAKAPAEKKPAAKKAAEKPAAEKGPAAEKEGGEEKKPARARKAPAAKAEASGEKAAKAKPAAKAKDEKTKDANKGAEAEAEAETKPKRSKAKAAAEEPAEQPAPAPRRRTPGARRPVVRAHARYVRTSARKARMVCGHLRGKSVQEARAILAFTPRDVARDWSKLLESAVANAENNHELLEDDLIVGEAYADEGPTIKRFRPRAMGRATPIRKRTSHLTITLTPRP